MFHHSELSSRQKRGMHPNTMCSFSLTIFKFGRFCPFSTKFKNFRTAAEAALTRIQSHKKDDTHFNTSLAAIRAQVQRELEAERKAKADLEKDTSHEVHQPKVLDDGYNRNLAAQGVYFRLVDFHFQFLPNIFPVVLESLKKIQQRSTPGQNKP